ncbi:MAG: hypothetical protein CR994_03005 [Maribacter sp.]|nr:MAG: hypothetical protein CR994_03005 [Maribacter sp.]
MSSVFNSFGNEVILTFFLKKTRVVDICVAKYKKPTPHVPSTGQRYDRDGNSPITKDQTGFYTTRPFLDITVDGVGRMFGDPINPSWIYSV